MVTWCWEETRSIMAFQRSWSIQTTQKLWLIIQSKITTSQPTTGSSTSDNLTCHRVVPPPKSSLSRWLAPKNSHGHETKLSQLSGESHTFSNASFEGCIFFVKISIQVHLWGRDPNREDEGEFLTWRFGDINGGIQTDDMTGEFAQVQQRLVHLVWLLWAGKVGSGFWSPKNVHLRSPATWCAAVPSRLLHWWQGKIGGVDFHGMGSLVQLGIFSEFVRLVRGWVRLAEGLGA